MEIQGWARTGRVKQGVRGGGWWMCIAFNPGAVFTLRD